MRVSVILLVASTLFAISARAQGPRAASSRWQDARVTAVGRLETGQRIRVTRSTSDTVTGSFLRTSDGLLVLEGGQSERTIRLADMTGLWVRGRANKTGAIAGAVLLAAGGALAGYAVAGLTGEQDVTFVGGAAIGALAGAAAGAFLGAFVGAFFKTWHRRYP